MFGFLNINKPPGPTSHDVVWRVRRMLPAGVKVGHAGTLDPFAEGVLVVCVGPAVRLADYVQAAEKRYVAEVTLGATSPTDDPESPIVPTAGACDPGEQAVRDALRRFIGEIEQVPPAHSAALVNGRRAYKIARAGRQPQLAPRKVTIHAIELLEYRWPRLRIAVRCASGTYIRSLARDVGAALGVGGYCSALRRTAVGTFTFEDAVTTNKLDIEKHIRSPLLALTGMPKITLSPADAMQVAHGNPVSLDAPAGELAALDASGRLLAIGPVRNGTFRPQKVLTET